MSLDYRIDERKCRVLHSARLKICIYISLSFSSEAAFQKKG